VEAWLGLGSNLGDRLGHLRRAVESLTAFGRVLARSAVYETAAVLSAAPGGDPQGPYLNAAVRLETALLPDQLMLRLLATERDAGRVRRPGQREEPRPIDLDVLLLGRTGDVVLVSERLTVPHPRLHLRAFALRPILDLAPALVHPALSLPLRVLYRLLPGSASSDELRAVDWL
jgi:2-amino-4-hydroxy-6-hydroxymethyldihydropteridine diphosphokinase